MPLIHQPQQNAYYDEYFQELNQRHDRLPSLLRGLPPRVRFEVALILFFESFQGRIVCADGLRHTRGSGLPIGWMWPPGLARRPKIKSYESAFVCSLDTLRKLRMTGVSFRV